MTEHTEDDTDTDNEAADQTDVGAVALASVAIISGDTKLIICSFIIDVDLVFVLFTWSTAFVHFSRTFLDRFIARVDRLVWILRTLDVCPLVLGPGALQQVVGVGHAGEAVDSQAAPHDEKC